MSDDDEFTPKLGRIRSTRTHQRKYLHRVLQGIARAGGRHAKGKRSRFDGSRIGRGSGVARVLRHASYRRRRVVVQARLVKLAGKGFVSARRHLRYLQREGVGREGEAGVLYDKERDATDGKSFMDEAKDDRHQFRFIVSPEDGAQYQDLKPLVRRLMAQMEEDLGTKLDWVAADHYNTGHPHSHIVVRGKDERGQNLIVSREYISHGLRARASELVSLDLGPRADFEIEAALKNEVEQERFTSLDRDLLKQTDTDLQVAAIARDPFRQTLRAGRLRKLERLGLASEFRAGNWQLSPELEKTLRQMGERGDVIKTLHRELTESRTPRNRSAYAIYDPEDPNVGKLVGRVVARGISDELYERRYLIVDGVDGRAHYVDAGLADPDTLPPQGGIVVISAVRPSLKKSDRTIAEIAATNGGCYSAALHAERDPRASPEFVLSHIRRLEALRRGGAGVDRGTDGIWMIPPDHLNQVEAFERKRSRAHPVEWKVVSAKPLEQLVTVEGATWLDRGLVSGAHQDWSHTGFGEEARAVAERRRLWLIQQGFGFAEDDRTIYPPWMLEDLQRRELTSAAARLSAELRLPYGETKRGAPIEGVFARKIDLASGQFAVIEKSREFTLVPWRPVLDDQLGKKVSGIMRGDEISWTFGRQRGGQSIS
jgi:type IV secretory pathway VirD2 relaxase